MRNMHARGLTARLPTVTYWRLPAKSANATVESPSMRRKPGGPPRCWMYGCASRSAVPRKALSRAAMNAASSTVMVHLREVDVGRGDRVEVVGQHVERDERDDLDDLAVGEHAACGLELGVGDVAALGRDRA